MHFDDADGDQRYEVVINHEEQYSIWQADRELPPGWTTVGKSGTKREVLDYIEEVWTDMRPLSLRRALFQQEVEARFGRMAPEQAGRLGAAGSAQLEAWRRRLESAASVEELLAPSPPSAR